MTWLPGGDFNWKISDAEGEPGTGWSVLALGGGLDLTGLSVGNPFAINLWSLASLAPETNGAAANFDPTTNYEWTILTAAGGITGFDSGLFTVNPFATNGTGGFVNGLDGGSLSVLRDGDSLKVVFTAVPEPATLVLAAMGLATAACRYMRRRRGEGRS
jgi:hypothetical protein